jgi:hypothetical protein
MAPGARRPALGQHRRGGIQRDHFVEVVRQLDRHRAGAAAQVQRPPAAGDLAQQAVVERGRIRRPPGVAPGDIRLGERGAGEIAEDLGSVHG